MLKKLKLTITSVFAFGLLVAPLTVPVLASAQAATDETIENGLCQGSTLKFGSGNDCTTNTGGAEENLNTLIADIVNIFSVIVAIVAVIMIIVGGFKYITSGGDSGNVTGAKNTILYAIIGLVVVALAQFVVKFVLSKATGFGN